jgi:hypothetical protein
MSFRLKSDTHTPGTYTRSVSERSMEEVGKILGVSRARIYQEEVRLFLKIAKEMVGDPNPEIPGLLDQFDEIFIEALAD